MFIAVTLFVGTSIYLTLVARRGDRRLFVGFARLINPVERGGILFILLGLVFGLATAAAGNLDFTAPWLIIAYVIFAIMFGLGAYEGTQWDRIIKATEVELASGGATATGPIESSRVQLLGVASVVGYVLIIFDMVLKPFS